MGPVEPCFRALASSIWMRRLCTLQEGALAKSLYFQFSDRAVNLQTELTNLLKLGNQDVRYLAMWRDLHREVC